MLALPTYLFIFTENLKSMYWYSYIIKLKVLFCFSFFSFPFLSNSPIRFLSAIETLLVWNAFSFFLIQQHETDEENYIMFVWNLIIFFSLSIYVIKHGILSLNVQNNALIFFFCFSGKILNLVCLNNNNKKKMFL